MCWQKRPPCGKGCGKPVRQLGVSQRPIGCQPASSGDAHGRKPGNVVINSLRGRRQCRAWQLVSFREQPRLFDERHGACALTGEKPGMLEARRYQSARCASCGNNAGASAMNPNNAARSHMAASHVSVATQSRNWSPRATRWRRQPRAARSLDRDKRCRQSGRRNGSSPPIVTKRSGPTHSQSVLQSDGGRNEHQSWRAASAAEPDKVRCRQCTGVRTCAGSRSSPAARSTKSSPAPACQSCRQGPATATTAGSHRAAR